MSSISTNVHGDGVIRATANTTGTLGTHWVQLSTKLQNSIGKSENAAEFEVTIFQPSFEMAKAYADAINSVNAPAKLEAA